MAANYTRYRLARAAVRLRNFTVLELQSITGVKTNTIYSFVSDLAPEFLQPDALPTSDRGRPRNRYTLTAAGVDHLVEVMSRISSMLAEDHEAVSKPAALDPIEVDTRDEQVQVATLSPGTRAVKDPFLGVSPMIRKLEATAKQIASTQLPILIEGEMGTGRETLARWIHAHGPRQSAPFVAYYCGAVPEQMQETGLFGWESDKAARMGLKPRVGPRMGLVELTQHGVLLLNEIDALTAPVQARLLQVLSEKRIRDSRNLEIEADVQLIATTSGNLKQGVYERKFREDLYYRLNAVHLVVPPLRERSEDIPLLANAFLRNLAYDLSRDCPALSPEAETALREYSWPGNIRELRNAMERVLLTSTSPVIKPSDLPSNLISGWLPEVGNTLAELERMYIAAVLRHESGKLNETATHLGIGRDLLKRKIKDYGLNEKLKN